MTDFWSECLWRVVRIIDLGKEVTLSSCYKKAILWKKLFHWKNSDVRRHTSETNVSIKQRLKAHAHVVKVTLVKSFSGPKIHSRNCLNHLYIVNCILYFWGFSCSFIAHSSPSLGIQVRHTRHVHVGCFLR